MNKIKLLISTESAANHSGLSETVRNIFIPLMQRHKDKYDIHQLGFFHIAGKEPVPWPIYHTKLNQTPRGLELDNDDRYGVQTFPDILAKVKPDIVFGFGDMWYFEHLLTSPLRNAYRLCVYYTIDGSPYFGHIDEDGSTDWGRKLSKADQIIVKSHFGRNVLYDSCKELKDKEIKVMYHSLDPNRFFKKVSEEDKLEFKKKLLPPEIAESAFICGWLGRNQFRKQNFKLWETGHYMIYGDYIECNNCHRVTIKEWNHAARSTMPISRLTLYDVGYDYSHCWHCKSEDIIQGVPNENFYLWFHMSKNDPGYNPDLHERIWLLKKNSIYTNGLSGVTGVSQEDVARIIASWDCMYYPSGGEGFSLPVAESLASGIPIVFSNYSSHAEMAKFGGLPVRVTYQPEIMHGIQRSVVDTNHAIEQLLKLVRSKELRHKLGTMGMQHMSQYSIPHMVDTWDKIFTDMMANPVPQDGNLIYSVNV